MEETVLIHEIDSQGVSIKIGKYGIKHIVIVLQDEDEYELISLDNSRMIYILNGDKRVMDFILAGSVVTVLSNK